MISKSAVAGEAFRQAPVFISFIASEEKAQARKCLYGDQTKQEALCGCGARKG